MAGRAEDLVGEVEGEFFSFLVFHEAGEFVGLGGFGGGFELAGFLEDFLGERDGAVGK